MIGSAMPLTLTASILAKMKYPRVTRSVAALTTTLSGSASFSSRAAMFTVSPSEGVTTLARSHLADHDARVDTTCGKTHVATLESCACEPRNGADHVEPCTNGLNRVVAQRVGIPEVREHPVALVLSDMAVKALDYLCASGVVRRD